MNPVPASSVSPHVLASLADAKPEPFWLDDPSAPDPASALTQNLRCDLLVVGGGFTGLWTALMAKEEDPSLDVVLVEGERIGWAATGRNGGFVSSSLTHGLPNGVDRFAAEMPTLTRLGDENLAAIEDTIERYASTRRGSATARLTVANEPWQVATSLSMQSWPSRTASSRDVWDADQVRGEVDSPTYLGAVHEARWHRDGQPGETGMGAGAGLSEPGCAHLRTHQSHRPDDESGGMVATTPLRKHRAAKVALATNIFPNLVKRARLYVVPVWDYVLMTEPLGATS